jgi:iron complex transport system substrate-binding protein
MKDLRIVSLLPAATEMVCALGLGDQLVGRSHECDYPPEVCGKPVVVRPAISLEGLSLREIDAAVSERLRTGASLYEVDERLLRDLAPDLILTQDLCRVCAPSGDEITQALRSLPKKPRVLYLTPKTLSDIFQNVREIAAAADRTAAAEQLIAGWNGRLDEIADATRGLKRRRVCFMEWLDPVYCGGHWMGEMIELAGGVDALARQGGDSVRVGWEQIVAWLPEVIILSPCGMDLAKALELAPQLVTLPAWSELPAVKQNRVFAVDANSYFARPAPRVVEGVELLAHLIHPEEFSWGGSRGAFAQVKTKRCESCGERFVCCGNGCGCGKVALSPAALRELQRQYGDCFCPKCLNKRAEREGATVETKGAVSEKLSGRSFCARFGW